MMTPRQGSQLCIKMAGYGIDNRVVAAIQKDAVDSCIKIISDSAYIEDDQRYFLEEKLKELLTSV